MVPPPRDTTALQRFHLLFQYLKRIGATLIGARVTAASPIAGLLSTGQRGR
jgi:hypothetical protein